MNLAADKKSAKAEPEFPQDIGAMKAYSLAIAQSAENNEPDEAVDYSHNSAELE